MKFSYNNFIQWFILYEEQKIKICENTKKISYTNISTFALMVHVVMFTKVVETYDILKVSKFYYNPVLYQKRS